MPAWGSISQFVDFIVVIVAFGAEMAVCLSLVMVEYSKSRSHTAVAVEASPTLSMSFLLGLTACTTSAVTRRRGGNPCQLYVCGKTPDSFRISYAALS